MARKSHPRNVIAAVEVLAREDRNLPAAEIRRRIAAGAYPELDPYPLPESTARYHVTRARRALPPTDRTLDIGQLTDALERQTAERVRDEIGRIHARSTLKPADLRQLEHLHRVIAGIRDRRQSRSAPARRGAAGRDQLEAEPSALLEGIAAAIADEPVAPAPNPPINGRT